MDIKLRSPRRETSKDVETGFETWRGGLCNDDAVHARNVASLRPTRVSASPARFFIGALCGQRWKCRTDDDAKGSKALYGSDPAKERALWFVLPDSCSTSVDQAPVGWKLCSENEAHFRRNATRPRYTRVLCNDFFSPFSFRIPSPFSSHVTIPNTTGPVGLLINARDIKTP